MGSSLIAVNWTSDIAPVLNKEFLGIQATIECGFTLKRVGDIMRTYSQNFNNIWSYDGKIMYKVNNEINVCYD